MCGLLLDLGASLDSTDDFGQKPIHLAAQSDKAEVVKMFLKQRQSLVSVITKVSQLITFSTTVDILREGIRIICVFCPAAVC